MSYYKSYKTKEQLNVSYGSTFLTTGKAPIIANRIWETLTDVQGWIEDPNSKAVAGLVVTVLQDYIYVDDIQGHHYGDDDYEKTVEHCDADGVYMIQYVYPEKAILPETDPQFDGSLKLVKLSDATSVFNATAGNISIEDVLNYYTSNTVEGALTQIAQTLNTVVGGVQTFKFNNQTPMTGDVVVITDSEYDEITNPLATVNTVLGAISTLNDSVIDRINTVYGVIDDLNSTIGETTDGLQEQIDRLNTTIGDVDGVFGEGNTVVGILMAMNTAIGEGGVQSDWSQTDNTKNDYIKNKPVLEAIATNAVAGNLTVNYNGVEGNLQDAVDSIDTRIAAISSLANGGIGTITLNNQRLEVVDGVVTIITDFDYDSISNPIATVNTVNGLRDEMVILNTTLVDRINAVEGTIEVLNSTLVERINTIEGEFEVFNSTLVERINGVIGEDLSGLEDQLNTVVGRVDTLEELVGELNETIGVVNSSIGTAVEELNGVIGTEIDDLQDQIDRLNTTIGDVDGVFGEGNTVVGILTAMNTAIGEGGVQSDWNQTDDTKKDYIKNKPVLAAVATNAVAGNVAFDDTLTQTGAIDVQSAIEVLNSKIQTATVGGISSFTVGGTSVVTIINNSAMGIVNAEQSTYGVYNENDNQLVTVNGVVSRLSDLNTVIGNTINEVYGEITILNSTLVERINTVEGELEIFNSTLGERINGVIGEDLGNIEERLDNIDGFITELNETIGIVNSNIGIAVDELNGVIGTEIDDLQDQIDILNTSLGELNTTVGTIDGLQDQIDKLNTTIGDVDGVFGEGNTVVGILMAMNTAIGEGGVQSDWLQEDTEKKDYIKNKPVLAPVATNAVAGNLTVNYNGVEGNLQDAVDSMDTRIAAISSLANGGIGTIVLGNQQLEVVDGVVTIITDHDYNKLTNPLATVESINGLRDDLNTVVGRVNTVEGQISELNGTIGTINDNINAALGELNTVIGNEIDDLQDQIDTLNETVGSINGTIGSALEELNGVIGEEIDGLQDQITDLNTNLGVLNETVGGIITNVDNLNETIGTVNSNIGIAVGELNTVVGGEIDDLQGQIDDLNTAIGSVVTPVQSNWNETDENSLAFILNKPTNVSTFTNDAGYVVNTALGIVAYTNSYNDLDDKPEIKVVNNNLVIGEFTQEFKTVNGIQIFGAGDISVNSTGGTLTGATIDNESLVDNNIAKLFTERGYYGIYNQTTNPLVTVNGVVARINTLNGVIGERFTEIQTQIDTINGTIGNIDGLQEQIDVLNTSVGNLNTSVGEINTNLGVLNTLIGTVNSNIGVAVSELNTVVGGEIDDLQDQIDDLNTAIGSVVTPVQSNWNETDENSLAFILNKPTIPAAQVNADWNATSGVAEILNKPTNVSAFTNDADYATKSYVDGQVNGVIGSVDDLQTQVTNLNNTIGDVEGTFGSGNTVVGVITAMNAAIGNAGYLTKTYEDIPKDWDLDNIITLITSLVDDRDAVTGKAYIGKLERGKNLPGELSDSSEDEINVIVEIINDNDPLGKLYRIIAFNNNKIGEYWELRDVGKNYTENKWLHLLTEQNLSGIVTRVSTLESQVNTVSGQITILNTTIGTVNSSIGTKINAAIGELDASAVIAVNTVNGVSLYTSVNEVNGKILTGPDTITLNKVAVTGSYNDLSNKPTIPAAQVNADWNAVGTVAEILNKPTIPTVGDARISIAYNNAVIGTFTTNQGSDQTINIEADKQINADWAETDSHSLAYIFNKPNVVSAFVNDAGYVVNTTLAKVAFSGSGLDVSVMFNGETTNVNAALGLVNGSIDSLKNKDNQILNTINGIAVDLNTVTGRVDTLQHNVFSLNNSIGTRINTAIGELDSSAVIATQDDDRIVIYTTVNEVNGKLMPGSSSIGDVIKLSKVAATGSYNDLSNKPTIPAAQVNADWSATSGVAEILNKPTNVSAFTNDAGYVVNTALGTVAYTNSYRDLSNKPNDGAADIATYNASNGIISLNLGIVQTNTTIGNRSGKPIVFYKNDLKVAVFNANSGTITGSQNSEYADVNNNLSLPECTITNTNSALGFSGWIMNSTTGTALPAGWSVPLTDYKTVFYAKWSPQTLNYITVPDCVVINLADNSLDGKWDVSICQNWLNSVSSYGYTLDARTLTFNKVNNNTYTTPTNNLIPITQPTYSTSNGVTLLIPSAALVEHNCTIDSIVLYDSNYSTYSKTTCEMAPLGWAPTSANSVTYNGTQYKMFYNYLNSSIQPDYARFTLHLINN